MATKKCPVCRGKHVKGSHKQRRRMAVRAASDGGQFYVVAGSSRLGPMSKTEAENIRRGYGAGARVERV